MTIIKRSAIILFLMLYVVSAKGQTTTEEYNYLTKGYKIQIEAGLDTKSGYTFVELGTYSTKQRSCIFKALVKQSSKKSVATLGIFNGANGKTFYFCIPSAGSPESLFDDYLRSLSLLDNAEAAREYAYFVSQLAAKVK